MNQPYSLAVDASGNLYVADLYNSRVLRFNHAASDTNGAAADGVLGQPNFTSNNGGLTQSTMNHPAGVGVDASEKLYVADYGNSRVLQFNAGSQTKTSEVQVGTPMSFILFQNYPNPFSPTTTIAYSMAQAAQVALKVYDVLRREVATLVNEHKASGSYTVSFEAGRYSSGIYFYKLQSGNFVQTKKMMLVK
jgi:hypothetical protein